MNTETNELYRGELEIAAAKARGEPIEEVEELGDGYVRMMDGTIKRVAFNRAQRRELKYPKNVDRERYG